MILEKNLNKLLSALPLFFKKLYPHRLHTGQYVSGEPFDYIVIMEGRTYCFDAKECSSDALYSSQIPVHQFNDMIKAEKYGATVFFLIYFVKHRTITFIHPMTILDDGKATHISKQVENDLSVVIKKYFNNK